MGLLFQILQTLLTGWISVIVLQMEQGAKLTFLSTGQKASQSLNLTSHTI